MPAHNALARIGPAVTLPGREPHASHVCGADQSSTRLRSGFEVQPATINPIERSQEFRTPQNLNAVEVKNTVGRTRMPAIFAIPEDYPEAAIGSYDREDSVDRFVFREGRRLDPAPLAPIIRFDASVEELERYDCLPNSAGLPLVGDRLGSFLKSQCNEDVQLISAIVITRDEKRLMRRIVNVTRTIAAVDRPASDVVPIPGTSTIMKFRRLRLKESALGASHIARLEEYRSYILLSDALVAKTKEEGFVGLSFIDPGDVHP